MRYLVIYFCILFNSIALSQVVDNVKGEFDATFKKVTFTAKVDSVNATKDGIYLNGYLVNIDYAEIQRLHGKTIKVTGKVTIVKGSNNQPKEYDKSGQEIIKQGRAEDTKHILSPKIKIIEP